MNRVRALVQGVAGLAVATVGVAAMGWLVRVFLWAAGL